MTASRLPRLAAALLLAGLGAACGKDKAPVVLCQLPPPQPSALPLPAQAGPGQSQAISLGVKTTGQAVTFEVPLGTASVTIVLQAASSAVPRTVRAGFSSAPNTPVPLRIEVAGNPNPIFYDVPMPPEAAFPVVDGLTVLDPLADPSLSVYFLSAGAWTGALTLPNTSVAIPGTAAGDGVPAGTWTVEVNDWAAECRAFPALGCTATTLTPSVYDVTVILKPAAAPSSALRVVFYLVTNTGLTAATAPGDERIQRVQDAMGWILSPAGITPAFEYRDVPLDVRLRYATGVDANDTGVCGAMGQLLQLAEPGNQLDVFLVDRIRDTATGGTTTVGLDPIVPGPASFGGTPASGVLVSIEDLPLNFPGGCPDLQLGIASACGPDIVAFIVAHEAGHFMGLYHTTEGIGTIVDPIGDTATCFCQQCGAAPSAPFQCQGLGQTDPLVTNPYLVDVTDCLDPAGSVPECGGGDNLMFWLLAPESKGLLTAGQAAVVRANPLVE